MTLEQWRQLTNAYVGYHESGAKWIPQSQITYRYELHHLEDYVVTSNIAGVCWLSPRK